MKQFKLSIHLFRRDLRLQDNTALIEALASSEQVVPCFIFDERQMEKNAYKGEHSLCFMANSLDELDVALRNKGSRLYYFYGKTEEVVDKLLEQLKADALFINRDYTPFARKRDAKLEKICQQHDVDFSLHADALLQEPEDVLKDDGKPYTVYTPAYKRSSKLPVRDIKRNQYQNYYHKKISGVNSAVIKRLLALPQESLLLKGGRDEGLSLIRRAAKFKNYKIDRDFPAKDGTSKLSAHHKFGTVSIREVYHAIVAEHGKSDHFIREIYWRDFFTHIAFHFPHVFGESFHREYDAIAWANNKSHFKAWCEGLTGFPIVDAGMRELNETGYMHNRVRMIVASFLTKDLHIDWRWGEKYFAQQLTDYDPAVNNGSWQWAASTGCDAQPYFRIFNPWLQQLKFDKECEYIKKWVPELRDLPPDDIHHLDSAQQNMFADYPAPVVDHKEQSAKAKMLFKALKDRWQDDK